MKKLIVLFIGALCSFQNSFSQKIINSTPYDISSFSVKCCRDLGLNCLIFISENNRILSFGLDGHANEIDKGYSYSIMMREDLSLEETESIIAHELVHIKQMQSGILKFSRDSIYFEDKKYPNITEHHGTDRHELQAIRVGTMLMEKNGGS
jgi:hypothetical protein